MGRLNAYRLFIFLAIILTVNVLGACSLNNDNTAFVTEKEFSPEDQKKKAIADGINSQFNINIDWTKYTHEQMLDIESRIRTSKRLELFYGATFDWRQLTLAELSAFEERAKMAKKVGNLIGREIYWPTYSLADLQKLESDALLDMEKGKKAKQETLQSAPRTADKDSLAASQPRNATRTARAFVIAPSYSTSQEAYAIIAKEGWTSSTLRDADVILVVVRSMTGYPLRGWHEDITDLKRDAESQLNLSGENIHVYVYEILDDLSVRELNHITYPARDL